MAYTTSDFLCAAAFNHLQFAEKILINMPPVVKREDITSIIIAAFQTENSDFIKKILDYLFEETKDQYERHKTRVALEDACDQYGVSKEIEEFISTYLPQDSDSEEKMQDADDCLNYQETHEENIDTNLLAVEGSEYTQTEGQTEQELISEMLD